MAGLDRNPTAPPAMVAENNYDRRKVFFHPRAIADLLETGDTWPVTVNTGFTTYCNHSCAWCSSAYTTRTAPSLKTRDRLVVDEDRWLHNVGILARRGTKGLIIAGQGEPLLHPGALSMLTGAVRAGLKFMIFTNGQRLDGKFHDVFFAGGLAIRFSVDAGTAETHRRWHAATNANGRGRADFAEVVANIRSLVAEKRRRGAVNPQIGCQMIVSSLTESDFEPFAALFRDIGVDYVAYKPLQGNAATRGLSVSTFDLHATEAERADAVRRQMAVLAGIKSRYERPGFAVHVKTDQMERAAVRRFNGAERYDRCRAHPLTPMIEPDGKVYLCIDHGGDDAFVIGNIYDDDFDAIWTSARRAEVAGRIDLAGGCPAGCFLDQTNLILHQLANPDPSLHRELI